MVFSYKESIVSFLDISRTFIGLQLMDTLSYVSIFLFLGSFGEPLPIVIFGLNNLLINLLILPIIVSVLEVSGSFFFKRYNQSNYKEMINTFYQTMFVLIIFMGIYWVLARFSEHILVFLTVEINQANFLLGPVENQSGGVLYQYTPL